ncbi:transglutaminase-like cysteine peptidase [Sphingomonas oleivorans]|nr:transglutaminase-like cysteine peptidase [Sphingomonas oleivorans]
MRDGGITLPPRGWLDYCGRNAKDPSCLAVQFDKEHWQQLLNVQASLRAIRRQDDSRNSGKADFWQVASKEQSADCEDIALAARKQLLDAGWPLSALRLATAWTERGEYHVVLTVDMMREGEKATYILDNRFATVLSYQKLASLGYRFHTRQAARGPNWVVIAS